MATGGENEEAYDKQRILRMSDLDKEPLQMLMPISGYEDMPIVPLEIAVEPLVELLPAVESYAYAAKERCKKPPPDNLTVDESAAIMLYTMGWKPLDKCLYHALNATLRSEDRDKLEPWFLYLKLFLTALARLPSTRTHVYRGVKLDLSKQYKRGETVVWWGFASCTTSINVLQSALFLGKTGTRTMFNIDCEFGKDIRSHSYYPKEDEILLVAATQFKVIGCLDLGNDCHQIQLKETRPPHPLLRPIRFPSDANILASETPVMSRITNNTQWKQHGIAIAGGNGEGDQLNQLNWPFGLSIDNDQQTIYIADWGNNRIVEWKFNAETGQVIAGGNGKGSEMNQLNYPTDVLVDIKNNSVIICDQGNRRVVEWSRQNGTKNGQILISDIDCFGITMDKHGYLYVSDIEKNEIRRWKRGETNGTIVAGENGLGEHLNQLNYPTCLFVDQDDSVYISDLHNHRIMKWMKNAKEGIIVAGGREQRDKLTELYYPKGVIVDHLGNVYVADSGNSRIMCWSKGSKEGRIIVGGNGKGEQSNQLNYSRGILFDREDNLYVVDCRNNRVQKFEIDKY